MEVFMSSKFKRNILQKNNLAILILHISAPLFFPPNPSYLVLFAKKYSTQFNPRETPTIVASLNTKKKPLN